MSSSPSSSPPSASRRSGQVPLPPLDPPSLQPLQDEASSDHLSPLRPPKDDPFGTNLSHPTPVRSSPAPAPPLGVPLPSRTVASATPPPISKSPRPRRTFSLVHHQPLSEDRSHPSSPSTTSHTSSQTSQYRARPNVHQPTRASLHIRHSSVLGVVSDKALLKKARSFLDDRAKPKSRLLSLWSFVEAANALDQALFLQRHAQSVWEVVLEVLTQQISKMRRKSSLSFLLPPSPFPTYTSLLFPSREKA